MNNYTINSISTNNIEALPINITFRSYEDLKYLGSFYEENGVLKFEGEVNKSGKIFTDFICKEFNDRINQLVKDKLNKEINKQLELELEC